MGGVSGDLWVCGVSGDVCVEGEYQVMCGGYQVMSGCVGVSGDVWMCGGIG